MNFVKRAWLYITRKKGKSLLLLLVLLVVGTFVLTALSLGNAAEAAQQSLRESLSGEIIVGTNYGEENPYLVVEEFEGGTLFYSTEQMTPQLIESIRKIDGVTGCGATVESLVVCQELSFFTGTIPIEEEFRQMTKIQGVWRSEENPLFTSGAIRLVEGTPILPEDSGKVLISKDLADRNNLSVGDVIPTEKGVELKIGGLFEPREIESASDQVTTYDKIQNLILADLETLVRLENGPAIQGFQELRVSVDDPQKMEQIIEKIKEIPDVDWKAFSIGTDNESYERAADSLSQISGLVSAFLAVTLVVSTVILTLILTMWARTRIHETGVLLSVGIRKLSVLGQYLTEVFLVAILAFALSYFSANAVAGSAGELLQSRQSAQEVQSEDGTVTASRSETGAETEEVETPALQVVIKWLDMVRLCFSGTGIVLVSVGISSISVMRLKPRQILTKMS